MYEDYRIVTDPWAPGPGWYVKILDKRYDGMDGYFHDIELDKENGRIKFEFTFTRCDQHRLHIKENPDKHPELQKLLFAILKDINNRLGDVFYA